MVEKPRPDSALVRFMIDTKHVRFVGKRIIRTYQSTTPSGMKFRFHTRDGSERHLLSEVLESHVYERFAIQEGDVVVDVGANIGVFTVLASRLVGNDGMVIGIEPAPASFQLLKKNLRLNHCQNVRIFRFALGARESIERLRIYNLSVLNSLLEWYRDDAKVHSSVSVVVKTLDGFADELGLKRLDLVKIDTEGYEMPILKASVKTLERLTPNVICEAHPTIGASGHDVAMYLSELGYECTVERKADDAEMVFARARQHS